MGRKRKPTKEEIATGIAVSLLTVFEEILKVSNISFIEYMNNNDKWSILNDDDLLLKSKDLDVVSVLNLFGTAFSEEEKKRFMTAYCNFTSKMLTLEEAVI